MTTIQLLFAQPWVERLGWTLIHFLWQGAFIAAIFALARRFALAANARYLLACTALAGMAGAPCVTFMLIGSISLSHGAAAATVAPDHAVPAMFETYLPSPGFWQRAVPYLVASWFIGVIAFSIRLLGGWVIATRLRTTAARVAPLEWQQTLKSLAQSIGVPRRIRLLISTAVDVPAVVGWIRPAILIPAGALAGFPPGYLEALLTHELAHIRRHDFFVNMLQNVIEAVLFYHPAVWWVSRQVRIERELCCDDLAVASSGDVLTYARALAELESARPAHASLAVAANGGSLVNRIRRLLAPSERDSHALPGLGAASIASLLILLGILAVANAQQRKSVAEPSIHRDEIWIDTVKQGDLQIDVRALGTLTSRTSARVLVVETRISDMRLGQQGFLELHRPQGRVSAIVARIDPQIVNNGRVAVDLQIPELPESRPAGEEIDATIHIETLPNVLYVHRPIFGAANSEELLFKLDSDGRQAIRVKVHYGRVSVNAIQILRGLAPGDNVILSDTSPFSKYDRILVQ